MAKMLIATVRTSSLVVILVMTVITLISNLSI